MVWNSPNQIQGVKDYVQENAVIIFESGQRDSMRCICVSSIHTVKRNAPRYICTCMQFFYAENIDAFNKQRIAAFHISPKEKKNKQYSIHHIVIYTFIAVTLSS